MRFNMMGFSRRWRMRSNYFRNVYLGLTIILFVAIPVHSQTAAEPAPSATKFSPASGQGGPNKDAVRLLYTGKGMGYFRVPDWQGPTADGGGCQDPAHQKNMSDAATEFEQVLNKQSRIDGANAAILLGAGD